MLVPHTVGGALLILIGFRKSCLPSIKLLTKFKFKAWLFLSGTRYVCDTQPLSVLNRLSSILIALRRQNDAFGSSLNTLFHWRKERFPSSTVCNDPRKYSSCLTYPWKANFDESCNQIRILFIHDLRYPKNLPRCWIVSDCNR